ncbi:MAG: Tox-REase-5 domain-containing protein [Coriobacteriia bacterium]|nr:Tox-REase-5 domain-containing protein [Coriobacteriia bacterium]
MAHGLTDSYVYDEFGADLTANQGATQPFGYTGYRFDAITDTYFAQMRSYDPLTGRFTASDPIQSGTNYYSYAKSNPLLFRDPTGLAAMSCLSMPETSIAPLPLFPYTPADAQRQLSYLRQQIADANSHLDTNRVLALENAQWQLQSKVDIFNSCHCPPGITSLLDIPDRPPFHDLTWADALLFAGIGVTLFLATIPPAALISASVTAQLWASSAVATAAGVLRFGGEAAGEVTLESDELGSELSGSWQAVNESMSDLSRAYQTQITGVAGESWVENGVKFDGIVDGTLIDAKGDYSHFIDGNGGFKDWFTNTGAQSLIDQANRQLAAANGTPINWYFMNQGDLDAVRNLFAREGITWIKFIYQPLK